MDIPVSEDGIILIAAKIYGTDSSDYQVFRDAAEIRKKRTKICIRYRELSGHHTDEEIHYRLANEFNLSFDMIKKIIRNKSKYDPHERRKKRGKHSQ